MKRVILIFLSVLCSVYAQNMSLININKQNSFIMDLEEWWGPEWSKKFQNTSIRPFRIVFDGEMIQDLRTRLLNHRPLTPPLQGVGFRYGVNSLVIEDWVQHWALKYPFKERESYLNKFPMYKTNIQGLDLQFIWIKPEVPPGTPIVPLLLVHGWPGSIREFYEALPLLTAYNDKGFAVEAVVPALPGFGFSESSSRPGLGGAEIAVILRNLMRRLGHQQFYIQAGDIGAAISSYMVTLFPKEVLGYHSNLAVSYAPPSLLLYFLGDLDPDLLVPPDLAKRLYPLSQRLPSLLEEFGYLLIQATKPDTVGIGLSDSPTGLLAYILEKFSTGTNAMNRDLEGGGLNGMIKDFILDNVMLYWVPNAMTTAMRFYANNYNRKLLERDLPAIPTPVPFWALQAKTEISYQPPSLLRVKYPNLLNATALDYGGHFFAFEQPKVFVESVFDALEAFRKWHRQNKILSLSQSAKNNLKGLIKLSRLLQQKADTSGILKYPEEFVKKTLSTAESDWIKMIESN